MKTPILLSGSRGSGSLVRLVLVAGVVLAAGCSSSTSPSNTGPTGSYVGTLVGNGVSGVVTITFPASGVAARSRDGWRFSIVREAEAATPISVTGQLAITGGSVIALTGTYDASASTSLNLTGGGYTIIGNYDAESGVFMGGFTGPGPTTGDWTASSGGTAVKVFCGTYTSTQEEGGGTWNLVLDTSNRLTGVAFTPQGALELNGTYNPTSMAMSITYTFGTATGTLNLTTGAGSGTYTGNSDAGNWTASTDGC